MTNQITNSAFRNHIVSIARTWLGTPYRHHASLKGVGADCLGLLRGVYKEIYGKAPEAPSYSPDWCEVPDAQGIFREPLLDAVKLYMHEVDKQEAREGDVILFRIFEHSPIKHCALLTSPTKIIHAYSEQEVREVPLGHWWKRRITHAFQFIQLNKEKRN